MEPEKPITEDWTLLSLAGIVAVLAVVLYFWSGTESEPETRWVFDQHQSDSFQSVQYRADTTSFTVKRSGGAWAITRPEIASPSDTEAISDWVDTILEPRLQDRFSPGPSENYGFKPNAPQILVNLASDTVELTLGPRLPTGTDHYLKVRSDTVPEMYVIASTTFTNLKKQLNDLRKKQLLQTGTDAIRSFSLESGSESVTYNRSGNFWTVRTNGDTIDLNDTETLKVNSALNKLTSLQARKFFDENPDNLGNQRGTVILRMPNRTVRLTLGGMSDGFRRIRRTGWPVVATRTDPSGDLNNLPVLPKTWPSRNQQGTM